MNKRSFGLDGAKAPRVNLTGGTVTALEPQARQPHRFNLYVDNHFALGLGAYVAVGVRVNQLLTNQELEALWQAEQVEAAHDRALRQLETRPRSAQEIRRRLQGKQTPAAIIDQVIARLTEAGLLSDRAFAQFWVENREGFKPRSARALKHELRQKGVPADEIARALKNLDEPDSAYRAARPQAARWKNLAARAFNEKLGGFLARRGFDYGVIRATVAKLWQEVHGQATNETWEQSELS